MIYEQLFTVVIRVVLCDRASPLSMNQARVHNEKVGSSQGSYSVRVAATSRASCFALFTADSVIILIGALLPYHIVVSSKPFPLRLCFLAGLFLPY